MILYRRREVAERLPLYKVFKPNPYGHIDDREDGVTSNE